MSRQGRTKEDQEAIDKWLKKNKITICDENEKTDPEDIVYLYKRPGPPKKKKQ